MKSFGEHLLAERALDQPMRAAATKSFELMRRTAYRVMEKALVEGAKKMFGRYPKNEIQKMGSTGSKEKDRAVFMGEMVRYYRDMVMLLTIHLNQKGFSQGDKDLRFYISDQDGSLPVFLMMRDRDGKKFLVLPKGITNKDFKRAYGVTHEPMMFVNISSDYRSMTGNTTAAGTYSTPKTILPPRTGIFDDSTSRAAPVTPAQGYSSGRIAIPTIAVNGVKSLKDPLRVMMENIAAAVIDGKTLTAASRHINDFMKKFDSELVTKQNTYIHEYIHFLDDIRYKEAEKPHPGNIKQGIEDFHKNITATGEKYYKSDSEWNAYFQSYAAEIEDAISSFLIACSNDRAVAKVSELLPNFGTLTPTQKGRELAEVVVLDMYRVMSNLSKEPWAQQKWGKDKSVSFASGNALFGFCGSLIAGSLARYSVRGAVSAFDIYMDDPKMKRKILQRIYQLTQDMEKVVLEYKVRMGQGKAISKQEWNKARSKFSRGGKGGYGSDSASVYQYLYSGLLIGTEPFDPKKNQG